ncbi:MAG: DUF721 domain-containing protein [Bacteroidaceae bacterium]|nr:DUF721 domain-containing protein [Bacteroidaceae bacterium]
MKRSYSESIDTVIGNWLREQGLETPLNQYRLINAWPQVVGNYFAKYTHDLNIYNQVLFVKVSSSAVRTELSMRKEQIKEHLNKIAGAQVIADIVFR